MLIGNVNFLAVQERKMYLKLRLMKKRGGADKSLLMGHVC